MGRSRQPKLVLGVLVLLMLIQVKAQHHPAENFCKRGLVRAQAQVSAQSQAVSPDSSELSRIQSELQQAQDKLKDWPNLGRYRDANLQVLPPAPGEDRALFMGDSITDGWGRK